MKKLMNRAEMVLGNETGDMPVGTIGVIAVSVFVIGGIVLFRNAIMDKLTDAKGVVDGWEVK